MHGLMASSSIFLLQGPEHGLGYVMYNENYDVWMGNARGSKYSTKHTEYASTSDNGFWNFSFHEVGIYDYPAMIDFILETTKKEALDFIGHSQACTSFLVMASVLPEYNDKVNHAVFLAPISEWTEKPAESEALDWYLGQMNFFADYFGVSQQFSLGDTWYAKLSRQFCHYNYNEMYYFCPKFLIMITGLEPNFQPPENFEKALKTVPTGASIRDLLHYIQIYKSGKFQAYDHGPVKNKEVYNKTTPPVYDLRKVDTTIFLYYAHKDKLAPNWDVKFLASKLPNVVETFKVLDKSFGHNDFIWNPKAMEQVYEHILMSLLTIPKKKIELQKVVVVEEIVEAPFN